MTAFEVDIFREQGNTLPAGFSIPAGQGEPETEFRVFDSAGNELPSQSAVLTTYPDKSPRFYRLVVPEAAGKIQVMPGKGNRKIQNPVVLENSAGHYRITNGCIEVEIDRKNLNINCKAGKQSFSFAVPEVELPGHGPLAAVTASGKVIENGPVQTVLHFQGEYRMPKGVTERRLWEMFITVYSNSSFIRVEPVFGVAHTEKHKTAPEDMTLTKSLKLSFNWHGGTDFRRAGMRNEKPLELSGSDSVRQWEFDRYEHGGKDYSGQLDGVFGLGSAAAGMMVSVPDLPESFPGGVTFSRNRMTIELMPEILPVDRYRERDKEYIQYFYLRKGVYELRGGLKKSFPLYVGFSAGWTEHPAALAMQTENVGMVEVNYLNDTGAWRHKIIPPGALSEPYDREVKTGLETWFKRRAAEKWYGIINYGDWHGERIYNWGNHEYDSATVFFEQALRFREPEYFREALLNARHQIDVDTVNDHPNANLKGAVYTHSLGHTGGYYKHGDFTLANYGAGSGLFIDGRFSMGHTRICGVATAYVLSGNSRFRDTALATGNFIRRDKMFKSRNWTGTHREPGWALVNLAGVYWLSGDERFLKSAEELARIVIEKADGHGVRYDVLAKHNAPPKPGGMTEEDKKYLTGALGFPSGYQTAGMMAVYKITGNPGLKAQIRENIIQCADYVKQRLYFPERKGFVHSPVPWRPQSTRNGGDAGNAVRNILWMDVLFTGNRESRAIAEDTNLQMLTRREIFASPLKGSDPDYPAVKSICSSVYFLPETLEMMDALKIVIPPFKTDTGNRYIGFNED